jgi:hypothetical protein
VTDEVFPNTRNVVVMVPILDEDDHVVDVEEIPILGWRLRLDLRRDRDGFTIAEPIVWDSLEDTDWVICDKDAKTFWLPRGVAADWRQAIASCLRRKRESRLRSVK